MGRWYICRVVYSDTGAVQTLYKRVIGRVQIAIHDGIGAFTAAEVRSVSFRIEDPVVPTDSAEVNVPGVKLAVARLQTVAVCMRL